MQITSVFVNFGTGNKYRSKRSINVPFFSLIYIYKSLDLLNNQHNKHNKNKQNTMYISITKIAVVGFQPI